MFPMLIVWLCVPLLLRVSLAATTPQFIPDENFHCWWSLLGWSSPPRSSLLSQHLNFSHNLDNEHIKSGFRKPVSPDSTLILKIRTSDLTKSRPSSSWLAWHLILTMCSLLFFLVQLRGLILDLPFPLSFFLCLCLSLCLVVHNLFVQVPCQILDLLLQHFKHLFELLVLLVQVLTQLHVFQLCPSCFRITNLCSNKKI